MISGQASKLSFFDRQEKVNEAMRGYIHGDISSDELHAVQDRYGLDYIQSVLAIADASRSRGERLATVLVPILVVVISIAVVAIVAASQAAR